VMPAPYYGAVWLLAYSFALRRQTRAKPITAVPNTIKVRTIAARDGSAEARVKKRRRAE